MFPKCSVLSGVKDNDENMFSLTKTNKTNILNNYLEATVSHQLLTNTFTRYKI
jgi:hypothetical protein